MGLRTLIESIFEKPGFTSGICPYFRNSISEMEIYSAPFWLRVLYPRQLLWRVPTSRREVFLTFDDGPIPGVTPLVLDILNRYNVKATFFCVGENVQKHPDVFSLLKSGGHVVGNHTFHHLKAWKSTREEYLSDVEQANALVGSSLFRPPHGQLNRRIAAHLKRKYKIVMWSALTGDYNQNLDGEQCLAHAIKHTRPGAIIVFHDSLKARQRMEYALPLYIEYCLSEGYSLGILE
jgi:peptidoglycan/xylan/chitin deacetylase (PgdA/CDA1 family)